MGGRPVIKGTRIPIDLILERLAYDLDLKMLFEDYPDLTEEDIKACIAYAKELVEDEEAFPADEGDVTQAHLSPVPYEKPSQAASCRGLLISLVPSNNLKIVSNARRKALLASSLSGTRLNS